MVTMNGQKIEILGNFPKAGQQAPDFTLIDTDMKPVSLKDYKGKVVILSIVPSLDTPVCTLQTRRFNAEANKLPSDIVVLTISKDLPFAQKRWIEMSGADKTKPLSDYRESSFATDYGVLIKDLHLLARSVIVIDKEGKVAYTEEVSEISNEPDYNAAIAAAKNLA